MLFAIILVLFIYFGGSSVPKVLKKNKDLLLGVIVGLILCSFLGMKLEGLSAGFESSVAALDTAPDIVTVDLDCLRISDGEAEMDFCRRTHRGRSHRQCESGGTSRDECNNLLPPIPISEDRDAPFRVRARNLPRSNNIVGVTLKCAAMAHSEEETNVCHQEHGQESYALCMADGFSEPGFDGEVCEGLLAYSAPTPQPPSVPTSRPPSVPTPPTPPPAGGRPNTAARRAFIHQMAMEEAARQAPAVPAPAVPAPAAVADPAVSPASLMFNPLLAVAPAYMRDFGLDDEGG